MFYFSTLPTRSNTKRKYSEFRGFKIKVHSKGSKMVVKSHICDKQLQNNKNMFVAQRIKMSRNPRFLREFKTLSKSFRAKPPMFILSREVFLQSFFRTNTMLRYLAAEAIYPIGCV